MPRIVSHALAKVNLMLSITGCGSDGRHKMESVFAFLPDIYDELIFDTDVEFNNASAHIPDIRDNSVIAAYRILKQHFRKKIPHLNIKKKLPIGGGVGGGSSDAACFINTVFDLWGTRQREKMMYLDIFRELGADTRVFLFKYFTDSQFVYLNGTGIQEEIFDISLNAHEKFVLLVNNGSRLSTTQVFRKYDENFEKGGKFEETVGRDRIDFKYLCNFQNSLEKPAIALEPSLAAITRDVETTTPAFCGVSGSGSTCFGVYENYDKAASAYQVLRRKYTFVGVSRIVEM